MPPASQAGRWAFICRNHRLALTVDPCYNPLPGRAGREGFTMINLQDIRYVRLGTRDLEGAIDYATKILGLQLVGREGKSAYFRSDTVPVAAIRATTRSSISRAIQRPHRSASI